MIISINGIPCTCEKGEFILTVARRNGIKIPTLCSHKALGEQGACRVCIVEVEKAAKEDCHRLRVPHFPGMQRGNRQ